MLLRLLYAINILHVQNNKTRFFEGLGAFRLTVKILAFLRLTVNFFLLRLT